MATPIKLNTDQLRTWRQNITVLVDDDQNWVRDVTEKENQVLFELGKKAKRTDRPQKAELHRDGKVQSQLFVKPVPFGEDITTEEWIDGYRTMSGRDYFMLSMLREHGECQLRRPTGQFLAQVRDPRQKRPTIKDSQMIAPKPENCQCKDWAGRDAGRHHKICSYNRYASEEQKAIEAGGALDNSTIEYVEKVPVAPASEIVEQRLMPPVKIDGVKIEPRREGDPPLKESPRHRRKKPQPLTETAPEKEPEVVFANDDGEVPPPDVDPFVLVNLQGEPKITRKATEEEVLEAEKHYQDRQMLRIKLGGRDYMLMPRSEAVSQGLHG